MLKVAIGSAEQQPIFCHHCQRTTMHESNQTFTHAITVGLAVTLITCGLGFPVLLWLAIMTPANKQICQTCGSSPPPQFSVN